MRRRTLFLFGAMELVATGISAAPARVLDPWLLSHRISTRYDYHDLQQIVPRGYSWHDFASLAPSPEALRRALFLPRPTTSALSNAGELDEDLDETCIRLAADSWAELMEKTQPTFAWNDGDLIWVCTEDDGRPYFILDEAYLCAPENGRARWLLLDEKTAPSEATAGRNVFAIAALWDSRPEPYCDAGLAESYAVVLARHPRFGTVYEIGWQCEMSGGTGHHVRLRHLYLLQGPAGRWLFLGEGIGNSYGKSGSTSMSHESEAHVRWNEDVTLAAPLEVRILGEQRSDPNLDDEDDPELEPGFVTYEEYVLRGPFPASVERVTARPYLVTASGDTLDTLAAHLAAWHPHKRERMERVPLIARWRAQLARLNPRLSQGGIEPGTRVEILDYADALDATSEVRFPKRASGDNR